MAWAIPTPRISAPFATALRAKAGTDITGTAEYPRVALTSDTSTPLPESEWTDEVRDRLEQRITDLVTAHVQGYGGAAEIEYIRGYPVLVNTPAETEFDLPSIKEPTVIFRGKPADAGRLAHVR